MHVALVTITVLSLLGVALVNAGAANSGLQPSSTNSLYGVKWGVQLPQTTQTSAQGWKAMFSALQSNPSLASNLKKYLLTPRAMMVGNYVGLVNDIEGIVKAYIQRVTNGDDSVGVQFVIDRVRPWECEACQRIPRRSDVACFKRWIVNVARAIGNTRAMIMVQPDSWFATCAPGYSSIYKKMIKYAVNVFRKLPRASVYVDGQSSDWSPYDIVADLLVDLGVGLPGVRGFTLGQTHFAPDSDQYKFGRAVVRELKAKHRISNRYFIVNRMLNGHPIKMSDNIHNRKCARAGETNCQALGRPPYVYSNDPYCDGYLWFGTFGMSPPNTNDMAGMGAFSPYANSLPPTSSDSSDSDYDSVLQQLLHIDETRGDTQIVTASSYLRDSAGLPRGPGWYKKGDPKHSNANQRAKAKRPPHCKRTDFGAGGTKTAFQWPQC